METLQDKIALATRHVEEARRIVEQQRKLIAEKRGVPDSLDLLRTFERSLAIFEGDLERVLWERETQIGTTQASGGFWSRAGSSRLPAQVSGAVWARPGERSPGSGLLVLI